MKKVLHFGAGNIGRGFIGKLLSEAGYEVIFADINATVIEHLNQKHSYDVHVVGEGIDRFDHIQNVSGIFSNDTDVVKRVITEVDLITTAVGPTVLGILAPILAKALEARYQDGGGPLDVIACENMVRGTTFLKTKVLDAASDALLIETNTGFVDSAVDRIVPPVSGGTEDPLAVTVESFCEWIVDETQFKGRLPEITGMQLTDNLMAFVERKLFTLNTGHATTAYLGKLEKKVTIKEAINTPEIYDKVKAVMSESGAVLVKRYGFDSKSHMAYIEKILKRFANPYLKDNVDRVGRQPLRKLSANDRLVKPLNGTLEYGLSHVAIVDAIAAALKYRNAEDEQAVELQDFLQTNGVAATLQKYSEITNAKIITEIEIAYNRY